MKDDEEIEKLMERAKSKAHDRMLDVAEKLLHTNNEKKVKKLKEEVNRIISEINDIEEALQILKSQGKITETFRPLEPFSF